MAIDDEQDAASLTARPMRFRRSGSKISADAAKRQGEVTHLAFILLGGRDAAIEFLNMPDADLGGRPLDVAVASDGGAADVIAIIKRISGERAKIQ